MILKLLRTSVENEVGKRPQHAWDSTLSKWTPPTGMFQLVAIPVVSLNGGRANTHVSKSRLRMHFFKLWAFEARMFETLIEFHVNVS